MGGGGGSSCSSCSSGSSGFLPIIIHIKSHKRIITAPDVERKIMLDIHYRSFHRPSLSEEFPQIRQGKIPVYSNK